MSTFLTEINEEKQKIVKTDGNVLVVANPGTGKTKLLAYKYVYLLEKGMKPEEILCLTFTNKAKRLLESRIMKLIQEQKLDTDTSKLNVHTFHSYALESTEDNDVVSSNLLRYVIYRYLKENEILNYGDEYLIDTIVPRTETLIRYLKNFGITPNEINLTETKKFIEGDEKLTKEELDKFAEYFVDIFRHYEDSKKMKGIDYADMLIEFLKLKSPQKFKYVLIDELQDVNTIEADIALRSAENFVAVGDKKQAIFGFQGGSIVNFRKFNKAKQFVLSENFRSTNEILGYAREWFASRTEDKEHIKDLKDLKNKEVGKGVIPSVFEVEKKDTYRAVCELVKNISKDAKQIGIIARTNSQVSSVSKALKDLGIDHSSTYVSASKDAKDKIISFLKGVMSNDVVLVKNSMFTPFFPISVQGAFEIANKEIKNIEELYNLCPAFKTLRESIKTIQDIDILFRERIIPVAVNYGREFMLAALNLQNSFQEALKYVDSLDIKNLSDYLLASDMLADESDVEKQITVTTVHKAKGREFEHVVYLPLKPRDTKSFQDIVVEAILKSKGIDAKEELEEESLRVDFVAFTRATKGLYIITDKAENYLNSTSQRADIEMELIESFNTSEKSRRAYNLFVNKEYEKAKELLETDKSWIINYVKNHFENIDSVSVTKLESDPYKYLIRNILKLGEFSEAMSLGSDVHKIASLTCKGEKCDVPEDCKPYVENIHSSLKIIKEKYPELVGTEEKVNLPLNSLLPSDEKMQFRSSIDAIFKNKDSYMIVDWKTDKDTSKAADHRQQLEAYKKAFSIKKGIPLDRIQVAICFIGLRKRINMGETEYEFDAKVPAKSAFDTFSKKVNTLLGWKKDVASFFEALSEKEQNDDIWRAVVEQWKKEKR